MLASNDKDRYQSELRDLRNKQIFFSSMSVRAAGQTQVQKK